MRWTMRPEPSMAITTAPRRAARSAAPPRRRRRRGRGRALNPQVRRARAREGVGQWLEYGLIQRNVIVPPGGLLVRLQVRRYVRAQISLRGTGAISETAKSTNSPARSTERRFSFGLGLTNECNLSCSFCYRDPTRVRPSDGLDQVRAVLDRVPVRSVNLGTGENGMHPDFKPMLDLLRASRSSSPSPRTAIRSR